MEKKVNLIGLLFLFTFIGLNAETPYFYYYNGAKQYLELDTKHIFVSVTDEDTEAILTFNKTKFSTLQADLPEKIRQEVKHKRFWTTLNIEDNISESIYLSKLTEIKDKGKNVIVAPYFKTKYQDKIGLSNFFLVRLKSLNDTTLLRKEIEKDHAIIVHQDEFMPLWFVASLTEHSKYNAMEIANRLYETGFFLHAVPDLMEDIKTNCANDTYFNQQWGLKNIGQYGGTREIDINICDAWETSTGSNITVTVLDQGINLTHPDLSANIHPLSFDCEALTSPQIVRGDHGTACAGIIGAIRNNSAGVSGIAPNCKLMSVSNSLAGSPLSRLRRADGINWAWQNGTDVISNSWGSTVWYQEIDEAINVALTQGRNGKGCIVVFSSGNDNGNVNYPANSNPNILVVGAMSPCGQRKSPNSCDGEYWWGSNYGNGLDVVAPGVFIPTTTWNGGYTQTFNGTSSATPHVAGIAALILSVNPDLTQKQVRDIIEQTAQKVGDYTYADSATYPMAPGTKKWAMA